MLFCQAKSRRAGSASKASSPLGQKMNMCGMQRSKAIVPGEDRKLLVATEVIKEDSKKKNVAKTESMVTKYIKVFFVAAFLSQAIPNKYLIYADDLFIWRFLALPLIYLPILGALFLHIYRSKDKAAVIFVALCGMVAVYPLMCTYSHFTHREAKKEKLLDRQDETKFVLQKVQNSKEHGTVQKWELTEDLNEKVQLFRVHIEYSGSGSYQDEVLFSLANGVPVASLSYYWSANQPKSFYPDWIVPLTYEPGNMRQFWLRICQEDSKSVLITVRKDGTFHLDDPIKAITPILLLFIPLALVFLRLKWEKIPIVLPYVLLILWLFAFAPWRIFS